MAGTAFGATAYTDEATFLTAAGGGLAFESFESGLAVGSTSVSFPGGTFTCSPSIYCPGFFGVRGIPTHGFNSVFFATPSTATFTFASPITAFGIDMIGAGTVGATDVTATFGAN